MLCSPCSAVEGWVYKEELEDAQPHSRRENKEAQLHISPQCGAGTTAGRWSWLESNFCSSLALWA